MTVLTMIGVVTFYIFVLFLMIKTNRYTNIKRGKEFFHGKYLFVYFISFTLIYYGYEWYEEAIKSNEALVYATDEYGNSASNEILRKTFELMGFDGIIDNTVSRFNMDGVYDDTKHIIAFQPNQIKSVNAKSWCKDNNNINLSNHIQKFISLGENISDDWQVIDERRCDEITLKENDLNTVFEFAQTPKTSKKKSKQKVYLFTARTL